MMERALASVGPRQQGRNRQGVGDATTVNLESRRERTARAKRTQILDAALEVFSRSGLQGARLDDIADKANISKANLFYYFTTKNPFTWPFSYVRSTNGSRRCRILRFRVSR